MRTSSTIQPLPFKTIERDKIWVLLRENITSEIVQTEEGEEIVWFYDEYRVETNDRPNLLIDIEENFTNWLSRAKEKEIEELAEKIRSKRNDLLAETDHYFYTDRVEVVPIGMADYRQALRGVPDQPGFPYEIDWPELPK